MDLKQDVLNKIEQGEVKMRPKLYFVLQAIGLIVATVLLFALSIFLVSFVFYLLRTSNLSLLPAFGQRGFVLFILLFPWLPVVVALVLTVVLSLILKRYSFVYHKPLLYLPVAVIAVITLASFLVHLTNLHETLENFSAQQGGLPILGSFYNNYRDPEHGRITVGQVVTMTSNQWQIQPALRPQVEVRISQSTVLPQPPIRTGEGVVVFGERDNGYIEAYEIRRIKIVLPSPSPTAP